MYLSRTHRQEDLFGLRASRCHGGKAQLEDISDYIEEDADGGSNLCLNHERSERGVRNIPIDII